MDARAERIMQAGQRTRFQPGNRLAVGHGRPRTGRLKEQFRKIANRWGGGSFITRGAQLAEYVLAEALKGDKDARELFCRVLGQEIAKEWLNVAENALESGRLRMRQDPPRVRVPHQTVKKRNEDCLKSGFSNTQDGFSQESAQATPNPPVFNVIEQNRAAENPKIDGFRPESSSFGGESLHELAARLVRAPERPAEAQEHAQAPTGRPKIKVERW